MARWTFVQHAGEHERFAATAWDNMIGKVVPMTYEGAPFGQGQLVAAKVSEDGSAVELTFETVSDHG